MLEAFLFTCYIIGALIIGALGCFHHMKSGTSGLDIFCYIAAFVVSPVIIIGVLVLTVVVNLKRTLSKL